MTTPRHNIARLLRIGFAALLLAGCERLDANLPDTFELVVAKLAREAPPRQQATPWGEWRGGGLQGAAPGVNYPVQWSGHELAGNEHIVWSTEINGLGHSSPVLTKDSLFLTTDTFQAGENSLTLVCLDRQSGGVRWKRAVAAPKGNTHGKNGHASATVATNGKLVFASFGPAGLYCFDVAGNFHWHVEAGNIRQKWGFASSPVLYQDLLFLLNDSQAESYLAAYEQSTGRQVWKTKRESQGSWTTPLLITAGEKSAEQSGAPARSQLIVNGGGADGAPGAVTSYDPRTGAQIWRVTGTSDIACPTALYADGRVISMSGGNGPIIAIRANGSGDVTKTHIAWRHPVGGPYVPTGLALEGRLFVLSDGGRVSCHRLSDGELLWRERLRGNFTASLVAADGNIYAVSETGNVSVFAAAADKFTLLGASRMHQRCLATPALADGMLFLRTTERLFCIAQPAPVSIASTPRENEQPTAAIAQAELAE